MPQIQVKNSRGKKSARNRGKIQRIENPIRLLKRHGRKENLSDRHRNRACRKANFEMYASGISPDKIAAKFNEEDIPSAGRIAF